MFRTAKTDQRHQIRSGKRCKRCKANASKGKAKASFPRSLRMQRTALGSMGGAVWARARDVPCLARSLPYCSPPILRSSATTRTAHRAASGHHPNSLSGQLPPYRITPLHTTTASCQIKGLGPRSPPSRPWPPCFPAEPLLYLAHSPLNPTHHLPPHRLHSSYSLATRPILRASITLILCLKAKQKSSSQWTRRHLVR